MEDIWVRIKEISDSNNGLVKTSQVEEAGISRAMLKKYVDGGYLKRIRKGLYVPTDELADEYACLQSQSSKLIFGYGTALYLWGLSDRTPHYMDVVVPQGTNISRVKRDNPYIRSHYVSKTLYEFGITETRTPQGATVRLYDKERCICDLIRDKEQIDMQVYVEAIKDYFKKSPNIRKLLKYGKQFQVEDKIRTYMEVL